MKRIFPGFWLMFALGAAPWLSGAEARGEVSHLPEASVVGRFLALDALDWKTVLAPPPAAGSTAALGDLETVLQAQAARTPADVAWAKLIEQDDLYADFGDVIGPWFEGKNLPVLAGFIRQVTADTQAVNRKVKDLYRRARPPIVEPTVVPCVRLPPTNSYPSGHSLRAFVWAAVLGDVFPDRQVELYTRARRVAWGRVIGGVHFPSDVVGGRMVAAALVAELRKNPAYRAAIERCQQEAAPFLLPKAA